MTNALESIFAALKAGVTGFGEVLGSAFTAISSIIWDPTTGLTLVGTLMLVGFIISIVWAVFAIVQKLMNLKRGNK